MEFYEGAHQNTVYLDKEETKKLTFILGAAALVLELDETHSEFVSKLLAEITK